MPQANYPEVIFEIQECGRDEMERGVADGSLDMALMSSPEAYRTLGIGLRSIKEAGPLSRFVIDYIRNNIR